MNCSGPYAFVNTLLVGLLLLSVDGLYRITTDGLFGIQPQVEDTPNRDITASSELGMTGAIRIHRLTPSPADTLVRLPDRLLKPEDEIAQGCPSDKNARFVITGRGGLPENPQAQLLRHPGLEDWREKLPRPPLPNRFEFSVSSPRQPSVPPSEAQGMQRDRHGKVHLLASPPNYHARWSALLANCGGKAG